MKGYPQYKVSGDRWIDLVPSHWQVNRLKYVADAQPSNIDKKSVDDQPAVRLCNYVDVYKNEFITDDLPFMEATATADQIHRFQLNAGDVLVTKDSEDPTDIAVPAVVMFDLPGVVCGYHLTLIRANSELLDGFYLHRLFQAYSFNQQFTVKANGVTRYGLPAAAITEAVVCVPPIEEQAAISLFLSKKTFLIDETIRKKKRLIELLQEERAVLINQAVTNGLDEFAILKGSKPDNSSEIHKKLKQVVFKIGSGVTPKGGAEVYQTTGIPLIRSQNIYSDGLRMEDVVYISEEVHDSMSNSKVLAGDVLLNITGASIGRCYYVESTLGEANVNQHVCIVRPSEGVLTKYLYYCLISHWGQSQIDVYQTGANREGLNYEQIGNMTFPFPDIATQEKVVSELDLLYHKVTEATSRLEKEIVLLSEYRTSLINEVVTGKVCVLSEEELEKLTKDQELVS